MRKSLSGLLLIAFAFVLGHFPLRAGTIQDVGLDRFTVGQQARLDPILAGLPPADTTMPLNFLPDAETMADLAALDAIRRLARQDRGADTARTPAAEYRPWLSLLLVGMALGTMGFAWRGERASELGPRHIVRYVARY
jgi:hypothetical protein